MPNTGKITDLTQIPAIDRAVDVLEIVDVSANASYSTTVNAMLGLTSAPVGLTDVQTLTNKTLTAPTISSPIFSGTITGTYTLAGTPTFPATVVLTTGTQTISGSKTFTNAILTAPTITNASITADAVTGFTTANTGTIYGLSIVAGVPAANTIPPTALQTGIQTSKFSNPYKFLVYLNNTTNQASNTIVKYGVKVFDTGSNYDNVTNFVFTAAVAGFYFFDANINFTGGGSFIFAASLTKNGTEYIRGTELFTASTGVDAVTCSGLMQLAAGDTVGAFFASSNTGNTAINFGSTPIQTYFSGYLVSTT